MEKISIIDEGETIKVINYNPLLIKQNEIIYELNVKSEENIITFSINDKSKFSSVYYNKFLFKREEHHPLTEPRATPAMMYLLSEK